MLRTKILLIVTSFLMLFVMLPQAAVYADAQSDLQHGVNAAGSGSSSCGDPQATINCKISSIINVLSSLVGVAAIIMVIVGGFRYITSAGDSNRVSSAKSTILYALIGLVIAALAQVIVRFVLKKAL